MLDDMSQAFFQVQRNPCSFRQMSTLNISVRLFLVYFLMFYMGALPIVSKKIRWAQVTFESNPQIKYLGISISPRLSELYILNYDSLLKKIEDHYDRWNKLPLTLIGCITTIKMKILPQINYLFSMILIT